MHIPGVGAWRNRRIDLLDLHPLVFAIPRHSHGEDDMLCDYAIIMAGLIASVFMAQSQLKISLLVPVLYGNSAYCCVMCLTIIR